jgi:hypothetical protein
MKKFIMSLCVLALVAAVSMAAPVSQIPTGTGTSGPLPAKFAGQMYRLQYDFDATSTALTADTNTCIQIPSNTRVLGVGYFVDTVEDGGTATMTIGDGTDADGWIASVSVTNGCTKSAFSTPVVTSTWAGVGTNATITITPAYGLGKVYTAADTIDVVFAAACDKLKMSVYAVCVQLTP